MTKYLKFNTVLKKYKYGIVFFLIVFLVGVSIGYISEYRVENLNLGQSEKFYNIFKNNFKVGITLMTVGAITGGVYSIVVMGLNGYIVGVVMKYLMDKGIVFLIINGLLPHIGFEVIGLICFALISCVPSIQLIKWLTTDSVSLDTNILNIIKTVVKLFLSGTILLLVAAIIEDYISIVGQW